MLDKLGKLIPLAKRLMAILSDPVKRKELWNKIARYNPVIWQLRTIRDSFAYKAALKVIKQQKVRKALAQLLPEHARERLDHVFFVTMYREPYFQSMLYLVLVPIIIHFFLPYVSSKSRVSVYILMFCSAAFFRKIADGAIYEIQEEDAEKLKGKTVVMTGGSDGFGFYAASHLSALKAEKVVLGVRGDKERRAKVVDAIKKEVQSLFDFEPHVMALPLDLSSFKSVAEFAKGVAAECPDGIDILICNGGIAGPRTAAEVQLTEDGLEPCLQVNAISHYYLVELLTPLVMKSQSKRIIMTSSSAHLQAQISDLDWESYSTPKPETYSTMRSYRVSKLAQLYHMRILMRKHGDAGLKVYTVMPGVVWTKLVGRVGASPVVEFLVRATMWTFGKNASAGSATILYCALDDTAKPGHHHQECRPTLMSRLARDDDQCKAFEAFADKTIPEVVVAEK